MNAKEKFATEIAAGIYKSEDRDEQYKLDQEYNGKLSNITKGVNTYWLSKPLRTVFNHKHSVYIEGGSQDIRFGVDRSKIVFSPISCKVSSLKHFI